MEPTADVGKSAMPNLPDPEPLYSLPDWLERLLDEPFSQSKSILIDRWLWYIQQEFEGVK